MDIKDFLNTKNFKSRKQLVKETGLSDREIRNKISKLKYSRVVLYNSNTSGYRLAKPIESMSNEELSKEIKLVQHCINDINARKKIFNKQKRSYIAYLKMVEKLRGNA